MDTKLKSILLTITFFLVLWRFRFEDAGRHSPSVCSEFESDSCSESVGSSAQGSEAGYSLNHSSKNVGQNRSYLLWDCVSRYAGNFAASHCCWCDVVHRRLSRGIYR